MKTLIVRPQPSCDLTCLELNKQGVATQALPLISIQPLSVAPALLSTEFSRSDLCILTSPNCVRQLHRYQASLPHDIHIVAVGKTTQVLAEAYFSKVLSPEVSTSEGVVSLLQPIVHHFKRALIIKGIGGRTLLRSWLSKNGLKVSCLSVYQREIVPKTELPEINWRNIENAVVTSAEQLELLVDYFKTEDLVKLNWFLPSDRVATLAKTKGLANIIVAGTMNEQICKAISRQTRKLNVRQ